MKKTYDWNVKLLVVFSNQSKTVQIVSSVHTLIHALKLQILKQLKMPIFDTQIELSYLGRPMKATSTLQQNGVTKNATLSAGLHRTTKVNLNQEENSVFLLEGLSIIALCTNQNCVNYNEDVLINVGFGQIPILQIITGLKCNFCPYKSQYLQPKMLCKSIKVNKCSYSLSGTEIDSHGIPVENKTKPVITSKPKQMNKFLQDHPWNINMLLKIKCL